MLVLRHNSLPPSTLFEIEQVKKLAKISETPKPPSLDLCLLDKTRAEIYTILLDYAERLGIYPTLDITRSEFLDFIIDVDKGYQPNPYHSFYHAADVALVLFHMLERYNVSQYLLPIDVAALFIAGLCHDLGHPGLNNNFQVNMKTELAIRYNNKSVLESYSCTLAMELITKHKLLSRLKRPLSADQVRTSIIKMILATDMVFHYELQENLANLLEILSDRAEDVAEQDEEAELQVKDIFESKGDKSPLDNFDMQSYMEGNASSTTVARSNSPMSGKSLNSRERQMLCQIVLHAADISNALRPWPICERWSDLVCEEFFRQGDEERKHGLPLSPNMDRSQVTQSTIGLQFGDFVVSPYFEIFAAMFPAAEEMLNVLKANRTEWLKREQEEAKAKAHSVPPDHPTSSGAATTGLHGRQPEDMLPDQSILNPSGRRVSVAAGMIIIPDELEERVVGSGKTKLKYLGLRSISDTGIPDTVARGSTGRSTPVETLRATEKIHNGRRRSEEPGYYLYRHRLKIVSRRSSRRYSRSDIVDKCLEQQCQVASTTSSP